MADRSFLKNIMPKRLLLCIKYLLEEVIPIKSICAAIREQKLLPVYHQLAEIVPDITHQYTSFDADSEYLKTSIRALHSFQITLVNEALYFVDSPLKETITIIDIGDSAGTHLQYIKGLHRNRNIRAVSINMDTEAVRRIKEKGLEAICARADDIASLSIEADMFLSFETLEHLMNPCGFLQSLSQINCKVFVVTVPYLPRSRVGLYHVRANQKRHVNSENTHIFELSPEDWQLIFKHSGWAIETDKIYLLYPRRSPFRFWLRRFWQRRSFEGYYGAILKPDKSWSSLYDGW